MVFPAMSEVAVMTNQYHYATYMSMADLYPIAHRQLSNNAQMALQRKLEQARYDMAQEDQASAPIRPSSSNRISFATGPDALRSPASIIAALARRLAAVSASAGVVENPSKS